MFPVKIAISPPLWHHLADGFWTRWVTTKSDGNEDVLHADQEKYGYLGTWKCSWIFHNSDDCSIEIACNSSIYVHDYLIKIHCLSHWIIDNTPVDSRPSNESVHSNHIWIRLGSIKFDLFWWCPNVWWYASKKYVFLFWIPLESSSFAYLFYPIGSMYAIHGNMDPINIPPLC